MTLGGARKDGPRGSWRLRPAAVLLLAIACGAPERDGEPSASLEPAEAGRAALFVEVAAASGLDAIHENGAEGAYLFPELMQPGVAFVDVDDDGWLDVYFVQSGALPADPATNPVGNRLFRNRGDGTYEDVTAASGTGDRGYGSGVAAADYDMDGDVDLYVTNLGRNTMYRNDGDGRFTDVTEQTGTGDTGYSTCAIFTDVDADGDLDLYVCNYVAWSPSIERPCFAPNGLPGYCSPGAYEAPQPDTLYRNEGNGRFTDISEISGIREESGTGLGVVAADFDDDGHMDIYVANDQMENFLWLGRGDGTFVNEALLAGCALNEHGRAEAGMGIATEDVDADGDWDLFMVHLGGETNTFYVNEGGLFDDATDELRLGAVSQPYTGFGVGLFDYDCDADFDIFIANGRVRLGDAMAEDDYAEPNQLLAGDGAGRFVDVSDEAGAALALEEVSRGVAFGDHDNDGDVDILVANNAGPLRLLRNDACDPGQSLVVRTRGRARDRDAIGTIVTLEAGGTLRRRLVQPGYSYCSSNDPRVHFGLGAAERVDAVTVTWPDGRTTRVESPVPGRELVVEEPAR